MQNTHKNSAMQASNSHAAKRQYVKLINKIQLSLLHFFCITRLRTAKSCQFFFLVGARMFSFVLFHHLYDILIMSLRPRCCKKIWSKLKSTFGAVIYHINGISFDKDTLLCWW